MKLTFVEFSLLWDLNIMILFNNGNIYASILQKEQRAIHMLVHDTKNAKNLIISWIYAPAQNRDKHEF